MSARFRLRNYWRMYRARGVRLPVRYFLNAHLFDLWHRTDTHRRIPVDEFPEKPTNLSNDFPHDASWTSVVKRAFVQLRGLAGEDFENLTFCDVGCGKGKVLLVWTALLKRHRLNQRVLGIEFCTQFAETALRNHDRMQLPHPELLVADARSLAFAQFRPLILYLYDPFGAEVLRPMLSDAASAAPWIIYNNPKSERVLLECGYELVWQSDGFHASEHTRIYRSTAAAQCFLAAAGNQPSAAPKRWSAQRMSSLPLSFVRACAAIIGSSFGGQ